jgi:recombination protein RecR
VLPDRVRSLTYLLSRLPGVGEKTAQRFAIHFVSESTELASELGMALAELKEHIGVCQRCGNIAERIPGEDPVCSICRDTRRDTSLLCVVARVQDAMALERSSAMRGRYFVLGRLLSPLDGVGPEQLPLDRLRQRLAEDGVKEVILATPPSVDGEATALLIARELSECGVRMSRIASGLPHGGDLEFADQITLGRAISGRRGVAVDD